MTVPFWLSFTLPAVVALGVLLGGPWIALGPVVLFVMIPLLDVVGGMDKENPEEAPRGKNRDALQDAPLWLWFPTQFALLGWTCWEVSTGRYSWGELAGLAFSLGLIAGAGGINVAHELMHRRGKAERAMAELMMTGVSYTHFCVEHVHGHHRYVATPLDPASSVLGETVFRFWPKSIIGGLRSFWRIETARVEKRGRGRFGLGDRRLRYVLLLTLAYGLAYAFTGVPGALFFGAQSFVGILLLETINYLEHYGLRRDEISPGKYERVRPQHSWNASQRVTNWYLYNLQRHSDHHYMASRPYWQLRHFDDVPQLPFGYATAFLVALCPPLWFRIMNHRVDAWNARSSETESPAAAA